MLTTTLETMDEVISAHIASVANVREEDHGIGSYEYAGARGYHRDIQMVCDAGDVLVRVPVSEVIEAYGAQPWSLDQGDIGLDDVEIDVVIDVVSVDSNNVTLRVIWTQR